MHTIRIRCDNSQGLRRIVDNRTTAKKYKEYHRFRDMLSGQISPPGAKEPKPSKRKTETASIRTPQKRVKHVETPSSQRFQDQELTTTPATSRKLFSPAPVTSLGPTPQRDGRILGLFDLMIEKELKTPSRKNKGATTHTPGGLTTPSKRVAGGVCDEVKLVRTPMSESKRQLLNTFATPLKNRQGETNCKTPTSISRLQFDTPAFLKRHSLPVADENAMFADPSPLKLPRKPLVRGLSEIVASLRQVEEDALDDDLEALRDLENDMNAPRMPSAPAKPTDEEHVILEKDSQTRPALLGGFDSEEMYDSPVEDGVDHNGNPVPVYKKKGQKRTTRKTNMRPVAKHRSQDPALRRDGDSDSGDMIPETQVVPGPGGEGAEDVDSAKGATPKQNDVAANKKNKVEGALKKGIRKVNEMAHANFRRLKLRNHGAKGGPGFNSRFRRRR